jgi:small subunit ribosomal protein S7
MPRRATIQPRPLEPDPVYSSRLVTQVINKVMSRGKKSTAETIVYRALDRIGEQTGKPPVEVLEQAIKTVTPVLEVRSRRVGGANYQVPVEVPQNRARTLAVRWLVTFARDRREKHMSDKLAGEILDALNQQGGAFKRKDDLYRMAQANKAFAHYRWYPRWRRRRRRSRWRTCATSGSWPTSTRARPRRPSGSSTTPGAPTRWARSTRARR